jgi:signal transduction histidine kinase
MEETQSLTFQPRARIIRTIGDQLISGPEAAIIELVKNAYDADASRVEVKFHPPLKAGEGRISVSDDGHGMSVDDIRLKWMEPATSYKAEARHSLSRGRVMMGSKGIGRFAAAKLGQMMSLTSTTQTGTGLKSVLIPELDWSEFSSDKYLSDVSIEYLEQDGDSAPGTIVEMLGLNQDWSEERLTQLYGELRRLLSPFLRTDDDEFAIYLNLEECTRESCGFDAGAMFDEVSEDGNITSGGEERFRVRPFPLLSACDYELVGSFDDAGLFTGSFQNNRSGGGAKDIDLLVPFGDEEDSPGVFDVTLYIFDRETKAIKRNLESVGLGHLKAADARKLLDSISGVAIYRDDFRIRPYGDPKNDWLALDRRRIQDPSLRIGHNQVAGYITVGSQDQTKLLERSSREGLEENAAFRRLTRLVTELLTKVVEPRRYKFRSDAGIARKPSTTFDEVRQLSDLSTVRKLVEKLEPTDREAARRTIDKASSELLSRIEQLRERQRILEAQSSLGGIIGEVLHEGGPSATFLANQALKLQGLVSQRKNGDLSEDELIGFLEARAPLLAEAGRALAQLFQRLKPLAGGRRGKLKAFRPNQRIDGACKIFEEHRIPIEVEYLSAKPEIVGYEEDLTTALVNLLGNAVHWLTESKTADPRIRIIVSDADKGVSIFVEDNGPGIPTEFAEHIFDVGFSLREDGTGLGLNIAREALARSGAKLFHHLERDDGAIFEILFPSFEGIEK